MNLLLSFYENNDKISVITGNNFQNHRPNSSASYYFTNSATVGGGPLGKELGANMMEIFSFGQIGLNLKVG